MTIAQFIKKHGVKVTFKQVATRPDIAAGEWIEGSTHYRVTVSANRKRMTCNYTMGPAHEAGSVRPEDVLDSLKLDAAFGEYSFPNFCSELGYDTDSRKAERIHKSCRRASVNLARILGAVAYAELLSGDVESL